MDETSARFINGLRQYDLTPKQITNGGWKYCGGDKEGRHLNYFNMVCPDDEIPEKAPHCDECVTTHFSYGQCSIACVGVVTNLCLLTALPPV